MSYGLYKDGEVIASFVAPLSMVSNVPVLTGDSLSLSRSISKSSAQRWEIETRLMPKTWDANELYAYFASHGMSEKYQLIVPQNTGVMAKRVKSASIPLCSGSAGSTSVSVSLWSGLAPAGTMVKFGNHNKLYMLTSTANPGASSLNIFPALRAGVSGGTRLYWQDDVIVDFWLDTDKVAGMVYTDGIVMDLGALTFLEVV